MATPPRVTSWEQMGHNITPKRAHNSPIQSGHKQTPQREVLTTPSESGIKPVDITRSKIDIVPRGSSVAGVTTPSSVNEGIVASTPLNKQQEASSDMLGSETMTTVSDCSDFNVSETDSIVSIHSSFYRNSSISEVMAIEETPVESRPPTYQVAESQTSPVPNHSIKNLNNLLRYWGITITLRSKLMIWLNWLKVLFLIEQDRLGLI